MNHSIVLYDACVLYPAPLRDLLMELATREIFKAKWSNKIHDEWIFNLLKSRPDLSKEKLERTRHLMNQSVLDSLVDDFDEIESTLNLPDSNDNHVLAAAIVSHANIIITFNLKDFPANYLNQYGMTAMHPDIFLMQLISSDQDVFLSAVENTRLRLRNPEKSLHEYLDILKNQGLNNAVNFLVQHQMALFLNPTP
jgi:predicted nucleic acid-binding protein